MIGEGALRFSEHCGLKWTPDDYFITQGRVEQLTLARLLGRLPLDHDEQCDPQKYSTFGAVARDRSSKVAAATSTGGIANKHMSRLEQMYLCISGAAP